jgi:hypothetical protein
LDEVLLLRGCVRFDVEPQNHGQEDGSGYREPYQAATRGLVLVARSVSIFMSRLLCHENGFCLPPIPSR